MPELSINGSRLYYEDSGEASRPAVLFSHGLLWNGDMFRAQVEGLSDRYRTVIYDHRGQGRSADDDRHSIDMDTLTLDAVALIERLALAPVHFVGLSMGGFVGMRLASRRPSLLASLSLLETSAEPEPARNVPKYRAMSLAARLFGVGALADRVMPIMFGESFMTDPARERERSELRAQLSGNRRSVWRAVAGVLDRPGVEHELGRISLPTLVMVGEEDTATPPERAERIRRGIPNARLVRVPAAGHSSTLEAPGFVTRQLREFLDGLVPRYDAASP